jgi:hypothetical protein
MLRIYVDFNTVQLYDYNRVDINTSYQREVEQSLKVGEVVFLYDSEMEVQGELNFDDKHQTWYAIPDSSTRRDIET